MAQSKSPATPLLLTNRVNQLPWFLPLNTPQYIGRSSVGIMCTMPYKRLKWCFVYRGDGLPLYQKWYDQVRHFSNGYAAVCNGEKWHFITLSGKVACRQRFLEVGSVNQDGEVSVLHPSYIDIQSRKPAWMVLTLPLYLT